MADFAALRRAHAANLSGAVRREVVLVHIALALDGLDGIEALPLVEHAQGKHGENLGLTALEQAGTMNQGQVVVLYHDGTDLVGGATVDALAGLDNHGAHRLLLRVS